MDMEEETHHTGYSDYTTQYDGEPGSWEETRIWGIVLVSILLVGCMGLTLFLMSRGLIQ
jgi:hypothetical protein